MFEISQSASLEYDVFKKNYKKSRVPSSVHHGIIERSFSDILKDYIIASEVLVTDPNIQLSGHIDLIGYRIETDSGSKRHHILSIIDFKPISTPNMGEFVRTLPQLISYAFLIKKILRSDIEFNQLFSNFDQLVSDGLVAAQSSKEEEINLTIECITFNKKGIWVFDPHKTFDIIQNMEDLIIFRSI